MGAADSPSSSTQASANVTAGGTAATEKNLAMQSTNGNPRKREQLAGLQKSLQENSDVIFANYRGISVFDLEQLRTSVGEHKATVQVVKNRIAKRVFDGLDIPVKPADDVWVGPTALIFGNGSGIAALKELVKFNKETSEIACSPKGALIDAKFYNAEETVALASLPGREHLLGMVAGTLQAPIQKLVRTLSELVARPVRQLAEVARKKSN